MAAPLYNRDILALAVENAKFPPLEHAALSGMRRSSVCGSQVALDLKIDAGGAICELGMQVQACALGQAAATLFARHSIGMKFQDLRAARDQLRAWLADQEQAPDWPEFAVLQAVKDYPARHDAILLPFDAAVMLLSEASA